MKMKMKIKMKMKMKINLLLKCILFGVDNKDKHLNIIY
jgi:hypothetical protein